MTRLNRLQALKTKLMPQFEEYAERHGGQRPCVEELLNFMIDDEVAREEEK